MARFRVCLCGCFTLLRSCCSHCCRHPIIVQRKTNCISLCDWDMKLGVLPLWSASKELSNDVLKVIIDGGHIFTKNRTQAKAITMVFHDFGSKFNPQQNW